MKNMSRQGSVRLPRPVKEVLRLFTAEGERLWVPGWAPRYPAPVEDDTVPGTVWLTDSEHGLTHWVVAARTAHGFTYGRITPGFTAGIVTIDAAPDADDGTDVRVGYHLTALSPGAEDHLDAFDAGFDDMLAEWQRLLDAWCAGEPSQE